jgi:glycosyltransferase involved in cell wall biosynthesis
MACGVPVAAYPVAGPIDVIGEGGVMDTDLREACIRALEVPRPRARARAEGFPWATCTRQFQFHLQPIPMPKAA